MQFEYTIHSDIDPETFVYAFTLQTWNTTGMEILLDLDKPLDASRGKNPDEINLIVLDIYFFISKSGYPLSEKYLTEPLTADVP